MKKLMFDLNDNVRVAYDKLEGDDSLFIGLEGTIEDVDVNEYNETVYGVRIEGFLDLLYFLAIELELI
jgi:hypothetical protein